MTQTQPDRLDQMESLIEKIDRKLDAIATEVQDIKLESRVFQAQTTVKLEAMSQRTDAVESNLTQRIDALDKKIDRIEIRINAQDLRFWDLIGILMTALFGTVAKLAFFPNPGA